MVPLRTQRSSTGYRAALDDDVPSAGFSHDDYRTPRPFRAATIAGNHDERKHWIYGLPDLGLTGRGLGLNTWPRKGSREGSRERDFGKLLQWARPRTDSRKLGIEGLSRDRDAGGFDLT